MLRHPRFKPHIRIDRVEGAGVLVLSEARQLVLQGRLYELVMPALDGRPVEDVCRELQRDASPAQVFHTIRQLENRGFLCEGNGQSPTTADALWTIQDLKPETVAERLATTTLSVIGLGVETDAISKQLLDSGVRIDDQGDLRLVLTDSYLNRDLEKFNAEALSDGRPWLLAKPNGVAFWLGPVFRPGKTACWECLAQRIRANFPVVGFLDEILEDGQSAATDLVRAPALMATALGLTATTVINWIARDGDLEFLDNQLCTLNLLNLQSDTHAIVQQPACYGCGEDGPQADAEPVPVELRSCPKTFTGDGGHRSVTPEQTLARYGHFVSPVSGVVSMLERITQSGDEDVMHVFASGHNNARGPQSLFHLRGDLRNLSGGKGMNETQAKASALCEALERYSAIYRGNEPRRQGKLEDFGGAAIHPNDCALFSDKQYEARYENHSCAIYDSVPRPFDKDEVTDWTPVWSLTRNEARYLPTAFCYFDCPQDGEEFIHSCSNGNSAGNTLEEAILQGFFELVERDAVGIWWYNRVQVPELDLDSFNEPYIDRLRNKLRDHNRDLWALDLTNDFGIPVVAAFSKRTDQSREHIMFGFGSHLDPKIAMLRAVTELNQMLVPILNIPPDGPFGDLNDHATVDWIVNATVGEHKYLLPSEEPARQADYYTRPETDDLLDDIRLCREAVERLGMEMLVLDQTRSEIGCPVVKVIVPGMRHFWVRRAPGRLYDVPVKMGWLSSPTREEDLNPLPMFL